MLRLLLLCVLASSPAFAQVRVEIRPEKPVFLEGEPVYLVADVTNLGPLPIEYGAVGHDLELSVNGIAPYAWRDRCDELAIEFSATLASHNPTLAPGRTQVLRYLLRGYRLVPGLHKVRVSGQVPVGWPPAPWRPPGAGPASGAIALARTDPIDGAFVDRTLPIVVQMGSEQALRAIFDSLLATAKSISVEGALARSGILSMAPAFLTDTIAGMARDPLAGPEPVYWALSDIDTAAARAHLRRLHDESNNLEHRASIVRALALTGHADNLDFFASLIPGRSAEPDDQVRAALFGLRCISGDRAAEAIGLATRSTNQALRVAAVQALGNSRSRVAVPLIIEAAALDTEILFAACRQLRTLTHYDWCDKKLPGQAFVRQPALWREWWKQNGARLPIYGPQEEPLPDAILPRVR